MGEPQSDKQGLKLSSGSGKAVRDQDVQENWGVDSFDPATIPVPGEKGLNLYDYIVKKEGRIDRREVRVIPQGTCDRVQARARHPDLGAQDAAGSCVGDRMWRHL